MVVHEGQTQGVTVRDVLDCFVTVGNYVVVVVASICSTQSENLRDLQIALRNLRTEANLQIACAICRLRNNARARSEDAAGTAVL